MAGQAKRTPINAISEQVKLSNQGSSSGVMVPDCVEITERAKQFLLIHTSSRESRDWTPSQRLMLLHVARLEDQMWSTLNQLESEGSVIEVGNGAMQLHPLYKLLSQLERSLFSLYSKLMLTPHSNAAIASEKRSMGMGFVSDSTPIREGQPDWSELRRQKREGK